MPLSTPAGTGVLIFFFTLTFPEPAQSLHGVFMILPAPWHSLHVLDMLKNPLVVLIWPLP